MDDAMFERIRQRRLAALAEALKTRHEKFSPFRIGPIVGVGWTAEASADRVTLQLDLGNNVRHELAHFYLAHATHLLRLGPADRTAYLCDVWLNYSRAVAASGAPPK